MRQKPTRGKYLLDLVLSDLHDSITTRVIAGVSDHALVLTHVSMAVPQRKTIQRPCFLFRQADWKSLAAEQRNIDWISHLPLEDPHAAVS